jgi:outer membrane protein OmpA-like peptidoglycan-associated protein
MLCRGIRNGLSLGVLGLVVFALALTSWQGTAQEGKKGEELPLPFIFWGGDVATFHANGGLQTKPDSLFGKHNLNLKLVPGDDFEGQVKDYLAGKSPFLRGTLSMLGQASDKLTAKPETTPVVFLQLTWSAGDHLVGRDSFKTLNDLKGKKIALQKGGPHVGMLNDILRTAKLGWKDITVVWTDDVSGDKGPAALFRKDKSVDACFAITPDMEGLTGGLDKTGSGEKDSVKGAHVVVSTAQMSRSIADVYACRKDFFDKNQELIAKLTAGYLKACEEVVDIKKKAEKEAGAKARYKGLIKLAQEIWKQDKALKDLVAKEEDVDGLISDATFVGLPGNISFFTNKGNLSGFAFKMQQAVALPDDPASQPARANPKELLSANLAYDNVKTLGGLTGKAITQPRFTFGAEDKIEPEKTIYSFNISFDPNQSSFPEAKYGQDFQRALEQASLFGNAVVAIRGHADPSLLVSLFLEGAKKDGLITGSDKDGYKLKDGKAFNPNDMKTIHEIIKANNLKARFRNQQYDLKESVEALDKLSKDRAAAVRRAVLGYGRSRSLLLDQSQIREAGAGVREPAGAAHTQDPKEWAKNRRVEFSIIKVPADKVLTDEFEL